MSFRIHERRATRGSSRLPALVALLLLLPPPCIAAEAPLLWEIRTPGSRVYLFGSMHVAPPSAYPLHTAIEEAFTSSDRLVVEIDITKTERNELTAAMEGRAAMPRGTSIEDIATDEELAIIAAGLESSPLRISDVMQVQPWLIELLATDPTGSPAGFNSEQGMDLHFLSRAHSRGIPVIELETVDEQIAALSGASVTSQLAWLVAGLVNRELGKGIAYLYELWRTGDEEALSAFLRLPVETDSRTRDVYNRLFAHRNEVWAERLETLITKSGTTFVVVGAGHLAGPGSLIDLLEKRGFQPRRVTE